ncbi:MAG TPA: hypothetical protein VFQ53_25475 [Kofleriaceae bacterium]|nr:hypothetical protein [Kofleriaceae bacterium]
MTAERDDVAWGAPDASGIAVGLKLASGKPAAGAVAYHVAFANRSSEPREVTLFATTDGRIRTRIVARGAGKEIVQPAIMPPRPVTSNYAMKVTIAAGDTIVHDGTPAVFELSGDATLQIVHGGVAAHPDELRSGEVTVTLLAPS